MDGTDRRIYQKWTIPLFKPTGAPQMPMVQIDESNGRKQITMYVQSAYSSGGGSSTPLSLDEVDAVIRALTLARDRLETLGAMEGMEKIVP